MYLFSVVFLFHLVTINSDEEIKNTRVEAKTIQCQDEKEIGKSCYYSEIPDDIPSFDDKGDVLSENTIFFIDMSCRKEIDAHQACAIEAAARINPDRPVVVFFAGPISVKIFENAVSSDTLKYTNVNFFRLNLTTLFFNTPLQELLPHERRCITHYFPEVVIFTILFKYGGVYVDFNTIVQKKLPKSKNWGGSTDEHSVGLGILALSTTSIGKRISTAIMNRYRYDPNDENWVISTGQEMLNEELNKVCVEASSTQQTGATCGGFKIYDKSYFYPINRNAWESYYAYSYARIPSFPIAFHLWRSHNDTLYLNSLYGRLVRKNCPKNKKITVGLKRLFSKRYH